MTSGQKDFWSKKLAFVLHFSCYFSSSSTGDYRKCWVTHCHLPLHYQVEPLLLLNRNWKIWTVVHFSVLIPASMVRSLFGLLLAWLTLLLDDWLALYFSLHCNAVPRVAAVLGLEVRISRLLPSLERQDGLVLRELLLIWESCAWSCFPSQHSYVIWREVTGWGILLCFKVKCLMLHEVKKLKLGV